MNLDAATRGALILDVNPATPLKKPGCRAAINRENRRAGSTLGGDVIIAVDGTRLTTLKT
jgi:S1-C subfamily serine protease